MHLNEPDRCRWCGSPALVRFAVIHTHVGESVASALEQRSRFSCGLHFPDQLAHLGTGLAVVVDQEYARQELERRAAVAGPSITLDDATRPFPPIRETVLRRPPPPSVRELSGPDLLRALAVELQRDLDAEDEGRS